MKRLNHFLLGILMTLVAMLLFVAPARAEYQPSPEFLAKMQSMIAMSSDLTMAFDPDASMTMRAVQAGKGHEEGEVAYFTLVAPNPDSPNGDSFIQFEEWRLQADGKFAVIFTKMWFDRAVRWTTFMGSSGGHTPEEALDIASPDVISKMEQAQKLLIEKGRPIILGGDAI